MTDLADDIRWVAICAADTAGRLIGKRVPARRWPALLERGLAAPNFHLVTSIENVPYPDMAVTGVHTGFRNGLLRPVPATAFRDPAEPHTLFVLADTYDAGGAAYEEAPRRILQRQVGRLADHGITATVATELEFYLFDTPVREAAARGFRDLVPAVWRNLDNDVLLTGRVAAYTDALAAALEQAGMPVEAIQGEGAPGQLEVNVGHADPLAAADRHVVFKHLARSVALAQGRSVTFMAKLRADHAGSGGHVHLGLLENGQSLFGTGAAPQGKGRRFLAGLLAFTPELTLLHAPYANSYRRLVPGSFTPLSATWGIENRSVMVRIVTDERGARIEFRLPGADMNPYHAIAGILAAGLAGLERDPPLPEPVTGDAAGSPGQPIPADLTLAVQAFAGSSVAREAFGRAVHAHLVGHAARELDAARRAVTDWDLARGFEYA